MTTAEMYKQITGADMPTRWEQRTPEQRQRAWDDYLQMARNTDDATQAEINAGVDQMLEHIHRNRTSPTEQIFDDQEDAVNAA